jgi:competence protein ComEC
VTGPARDDEPRAEEEGGGGAEPSPPPGAVLGPLPWWAATLVVGALVGERAAIATGRAAAVAGVAASTALVATARVLSVGLHTTRPPRSADRSRTATVTPRRGTAATAALLAVLAVGLAGTSARLASADHGLLRQLADRGGTVPVVVTVAHEPRPTALGWHAVVRVEEVAGTTTRERAAITLETDPPPLGQRLTATASARPLPAGGYGRWLARQHAAVVLDARRWEPHGRPGPLARSTEHVRATVRTAATARQPARVGGLLVGFVTGDTRLLDDEDARAMQATGLTHLTAVSGTHVAILAAGVLGACALARVGGWGRRWLLAGVLVGFAFLTRFQPSVLRAGTMGLVVLLAGVRGVPRDARHALAGAVLLLVLVDPLLAGSLGLLLSASAAAGVLVLAPLVRERLHRLPRRLAAVLAVTVGAQLAVVPLLLSTFGEVPLASVPANVVAVPFAAVAIAGAFLAALVSVAVPTLGAWLFAATGLPARVVLWSAHAFADVGWIANTGRPATVLLLGLGALWLVATPRRRPARTALAVVTAVAIAGAGWPLVHGRLPVRTLTVTAIDVGQGDAFLLESPEAKVLVDAGEDDTAARWLRANGRRHLDLLVVTHGHLDHVGGTAPVLRSVRVGTVWYRHVPTELPAIGELFAAAAERSVPVRGPATGDRAVVGDLLLEVLSPPPGRPYRWSRSELNDTSIVVLATWQGRRVLLPGDAEAPAQADLLALAARWGRSDLLDVDLLTVPHHGSATTDPAFLRATRPQVAVISAGRDNRHGHPHPAVVAVLDELGAEVRRTDLEGTVRVEVPARRPPTAGSRPRVVAGSCRRHQRVGSAHAARAPPRRRRRPPPAPRARAAAGRPARRGSRPPRRDLRRPGDRAPARAAHRLAVRGPDLRRRARGGAAGR